MYNVHLHNVEKYICEVTLHSRTVLNIQCSSWKGQGPLITEDEPFTIKGLAVELLADDN